MRVGHAYAAMHLHGFVRNKVKGLSGASLRQRRQLANIVGIGVQRGEGSADA